MSYANVLSTIALLVSVGAFSISYFQYVNTFENSELKWKMSDFSIQYQENESKVELISNIDFAVTNNSNSPLYLAACNFEVDNGYSGRGGLEKLWIPCPDFEQDLASKGEIAIAAGQTKFFKDSFKFTQPTTNLKETLDQLGIQPTAVTETIFRMGENSCSTNFAVRIEGGHYSSNCRIRSDTKLFAISIQTGSGKYVGGDIRYGFQDDWPWAWSRF